MKGQAVFDIDSCMSCKDLTWSIMLNKQAFVSLRMSQLQRYSFTIIQCYLFSNLSQVRDGKGYSIMIILQSNILLTMLLVLSFLFLWISGRERDHNEGSWSDRVISRSNIWLDYELGQVTQISVIVIQTSNSQFHDVVLLPIFISTHFCCLVDSFQSSESYSKIWWCMFISPDGMF
jgi:hypothetical protein